VLSGARKAAIAAAQCSILPAIFQSEGQPVAASAPGPGAAFAGWAKFETLFLTAATIASTGGNGKRKTEKEH